MNRKVVVIGSLVFAVIASLGTMVVLFQLNHRGTVETPGSGAIATARSRGVEFEVIQARARDFGLSCLTAGQEICETMVARAEKNPRLKAVFLQSKAAGVLILPKDQPIGGFYVGEGYVSINTLAEDQTIIAFLTK